MPSGQYRNQSEKTSKILIQKYGSVENLIEHAHELKGKQQENVINFAQQGLESKLLATIVTDLDVEFNEDDLIMCPPDDAAKLRIRSPTSTKNMKFACIT